MLKFAELNRMPANDEAAAARTKRFSEFPPNMRYDINVLIGRWNNMFPSAMTFSDLTPAQRRELVDPENSLGAFILATRKFDKQGEIATDFIPPRKSGPMPSVEWPLQKYRTELFDHLEPSVWKASDNEYRVFLPAIGTMTVSVPFTLSEVEKLDNGGKRNVDRTYDVPKTHTDKDFFLERIVERARLDAMAESVPAKKKSD